MAPLQTIKTAKGFALFESLLCLNLFIISCWGGGLILLIITTNIWLHAQIHEALICLKTGESRSSCERSFNKNSRLILKIGKLQGFQVLKNSEDETRLKIVWKVQNFHFSLQREVNWKQVLKKKAFSP